ncbi:uncharacterized protein UV8b_05999 [Ustilaginoidea virens]|uniref:Serine hydrolase domain-containing protein n=1 Tax=Ustilaginoidea virens TaxID=1159556 RepID=A0A063BTK0_USTVR|nr:uncharacterized protein UV8b_05999 [Ustilaginoidea virens]QUC21756.1 hypothetical protein UV8b_05999 [Ustilaginoidea virens]GAO17451.1 hypothetical protein UVI_02052090 [Ustilaginoidea virens]
MTAETPQDLALPRILCLHGGGVNARVFRLQCRTLIARLRDSFRLVFVDGPYPCAPHDDIVPVYGDLGPFFRWLPAEGERCNPPAAAADDVMTACLAAMGRDPGSGPWVGVLGFSQGAKIAVSLLWAQQRAAERARTDFKFGVVMAGSAPVVRLDMRLDQPRHVAEPLMSSVDFDDWPPEPCGDHVVDIPTLHVHGLQDAGIDRHRRLLALYCRPVQTRLVEWDGGHRLPFKTADAQLVVEEMLRMARGAGVFC